MKRTIGFIIIAAASAAACNDSPTEPTPSQGSEYGVVLSSTVRTLTVFDPETDAVVREIGLGPAGSPVSLAVRGGQAAVPMGTFPSLALVDLATGAVRSVSLPANSGATGVAFLNDSIVVVGNSNLNTVSIVNTVSGAHRAELAVGRFPQAVIARNDTAWVVNAELGPDFLPARTGTLSIVAGRPSQVVGTIELSADNPGAVTFAPDGRLLVTFAGDFGSANGSLGIVDTRTRTETARVASVGEFPGAVAATGSSAFVGSFGGGITTVDLTTRVVTRTPANAILPGGLGVSGIAFDGDGRLYALKPDCQDPSSTYRLSGTFTIAATIPVGVCPFAIAFTQF